MSSPLSWRTQVLRFTFFNESNGTPPNPLWGSIAGGEPETILEKKKDGELVEEGSWNQGILRISQAAGRTDIVLRTVSDESGFSDVGALAELVPLFADLLPKSLPGRILRVAFGAVVHVLVEDRRSAYVTLADMLPSVKLDPDSSDFLYQINRPIASEIAPTTINRLTKWGAILIRLVRVADAKIALSERYAAFLELDISTAANTNLDVGNEVPHQLMNELVTQGLRIANEGDQP